MSETTGESRLAEFMGQIVGYMTGGAMCYGIWLGDELGLYGSLARIGPATADELGAEAGCHVRLVREWLDGQVAGGLIAWDDTSDRYSMSPEAVMALADDESPTFVARAMNAFVSFFIDMPKVADAFRGDGALSWGDDHPCLFAGTEWFFRTGYRAALPAWIAALDGVADKLTGGASVADVGCGHGASVVVLAQSFPRAHITGFDFHAPSIEIARQRAEEAAVSGQTSFEVADAKGYPGTFDSICFFDCLHDMGDPVGIARYALDHLAKDGTVLLVEPYALDGRAENIAGNPMAALLYTASSSVCTPNSLSQEVGLGIGAQAGEARLREVFEQAGLHALSERGGDTAQHDPRSEALNQPSQAVDTRRPVKSSVDCAGGAARSAARDLSARR
jgi:SAM-dependent methyltransferase